MIPTYTDRSFRLALCLSEHLHVHFRFAPLFMCEEGKSRSFGDMDHPPKRRKTGHSYLDIHASDHARLHLGDIYETQTNNYYNASETARKAEAILESLKSKHDNLNRRRENLPEAAHSTFEWLFETSSTFSDWLHTPHDVDLFWIAGKPGSGKSTLMKFITEDDRTLESLQTWAGHGKILIASHFFWHPGNAEQRTDTGLLRNLLHQLCEADPELIRIVFEKRWARGEQYWAKPWGTKELWESLLRMQTASDRSICLFIDGLDESQPRDCHAELSRWLLELAAISNFKVCVSGRPWQPFRGFFEPLNLRLTLETMTDRDITSYTYDKFLCARSLASGESRCDANSAASLKTLAMLVTSRAEGVFLWARSIVDILCQHMATGANDQELRAHLLEFPRELGDYYRQMIYDRVHSTWSSLCASFLKLALVLAKNDAVHLPTVDWRIYWVAERLHKARARSNFQHQPPRMFSASVLQEKRTFVENTISAACGGFLCMYKQDCSRGPRYTVDFAHSSVVEFLETQEMKEVLERNAPSYFSENDFIPTVLLELCKIGPSEADLTDASCDDLHEDIWAMFQSIGIREASRHYEVQLERSAVFFHENYCAPQNKHFGHETEPGHSEELVALTMKGLMYCSLFQYADRVIRTWPGSLAFSSLASRSLELALAIPGRIEYKFVELLLEHGADIRCCTLAWINFLRGWFESHGEAAFDRSMWTVARLLIRHGACLTSIVGLPQYHRCAEVKVLLAACVPEEATGQLDVLLEDVSSPDAELRIASRIEEVRDAMWPEPQTWEGQSAQMSIETGVV